MDYSQIHFGKAREKLTWKDLENFFKNPQSESDNIEFKSYPQNGNLDKQYEDIYVSVISFLNSNGGIIIWGAPKGTPSNGRKEKIFQGALTPINIILQKDSVISKVSNRITPLPNNINVKIVENGAGCVCVFEIQKSLHAHQINGTYYMRLDGQTVPAPHHYVEALIKQVRYPDLEGILKIGGLNDITHKRISHLTIMVIISNLSPLQNELNVSFRLMTPMGKFRGFGFATGGFTYGQGGKHWCLNDTARVLHYSEKLKHSETIELEGPVSSFENVALELTLQFAGRYSPMKQSYYKLELRKLEPGESPDNLIIDKLENVFVHELGD